MITETVTDTTAAVVTAFIELQVSNRGTELAEMLINDAVLDLNPPQWRLQVQGARTISEALARSFPSGYRTVGCTWEPTSQGAVVEYDGWDIANGEYYRHLAVLGFRGAKITRLTIYCTGAWDRDTIEKQRREAPMVDGNALTGGTR